MSFKIFFEIVLEAVFGAVLEVVLELLGGKLPLKLSLRLGGGGLSVSWENFSRLTMIALGGLPYHKNWIRG